jgi:choline kinase
MPGERRSPAVIIGAGRGRRLGPLTAEVPKTLVPVLGRPMLEHILAALAASGYAPGEVTFIAGYRADVLARAHPELRIVLNEAWADNNILASLLCARDRLTGGFLSSYADIVYRPEAVAKLLASPHAITLVADTDWRRRYRRRTAHPESDAEKLRADASGRVLELSRRIASDAATGEFIGVALFTAAGAASLLSAYDAVQARFGDDGPFHEGRSLRKAYLIDLLSHMIARGEAVHAVSMHGGYMEIDTTEDAALAETWWQGGG